MTEITEMTVVTLMTHVMCKRSPDNFSSTRLRHARSLLSGICFHELLLKRSPIKSLGDDGN